MLPVASTVLIFNGKLIFMESFRLRVFIQRTLETLILNSLLESAA